MNRLDFYSGHEVDGVVGLAGHLRNLASSRIRAASMVAAGDDPSDSSVGELLADAERLLVGADRAERRMPPAFELTDSPTILRLAVQARALRLALSGADHNDRADLESLDELAFGLEIALGRIAEKHESDRKALTKAVAAAKRKALAKGAKKVAA